MRALLAVHFVGGGPLDLQAIAQETGITRSNASTELVRLEAEGLVVRTPDPYDRRRIRARLTPAGTRRLAEWLRAGVSAIGASFSEFSDNDLERLTRLAEKIGDPLVHPEISDVRLQAVRDMYPDLSFAGMDTAFAIGRASDAILAHVDGALSGARLSLRHANALILISHLDGAPLSLASLSPLLGLNRASAGRILRELEERDAIERRTDEADRRRIRATVTAEGERMLAVLVPVLAESYRASLSSLSDKEQDELLQLLHKIVADT
ncbi:MarR family winged helix-turn-helix transcriptional regulator [Arthrobacter sp. SD76]|uniref:MarR family winged helix-turn-helix transcriptional regulator n=1 Tax=Arthrobacter sp. SD76 TaxID=3415007 RepID=UPI003C7437DA